MILDSIVNAAAYFPIGARFAAGLSFLQRDDVNAVALGRHEIDSDRVFALVQEYSTKQPGECFWEAHRRYADIQFIASGTESIAWSPIELMRVKTGYDAEKDFLVLDGTARETFTLTAGQFAILLPHDAHMPCLATRSGGVRVRKIVVKVAID